ncbi:DUF3179 domain-containing protein [Rhabdothermincola salaria]|uniref:DUF3179 domain-containing protein n=1 Tax=Rhabdothermincola salaria TaxID=2903142 RepID=UPI001E625346|nr:DUF3179 domain-containing protein [Rhabdothermincola salaria]MCD9624251.1 DUF3179 domain-containing protein [Rhabdothermincola salaria]
MRTPAALLAGALFLAGCAGTATDDTASQPSGPAPTPVTVTQIEPGPREDVPSALGNPAAEGLPTPLVDPEAIISGGPPPDGIPPIDEPTFLETDEVDFIADEEPVLAFELEGDARAYPIQVLIWHEIVNDTVGGVPVTVTYCPLCNTAVAVDRRVDDRTLSFSTSGSLYQSALVMYDRQTESLWSHFTGEAIAGVLTGEQLDRHPVATVAWKDWREANPDGLVLSRETGHDRSYGRNPYPGYDDVNSEPFLFEGETDGRLAAKTRVVGVGLDAEPTAIRLEPLLDEGVLELELDGEPAVAWALPGTASALDAGDVPDGRDVGATGVFSRTVDGQDLTFSRTDDGFRDDETGSAWNVLGQATSGPLEGSQLRAFEHVDTFWFAWAAFAPETRVLP